MTKTESKTTVGGSRDRDTRDARDTRETRAQVIRSYKMLHSSREGSSSAQKLLQKYRRHRLRLLRRREYDRLRTMVPSIATRPKVSKVTVIEEAIKYIDHLHCALIARLQTKGLPQAFKGLGLQAKDFQHIDQSEIRELVRHVFPSGGGEQPSGGGREQTTSSGSSIERSRSVASYLSRRPRWQPRHL